MRENHDWLAIKQTIHNPRQPLFLLTVSMCVEVDTSVREMS